MSAIPGATVIPDQNPTYEEVIVVTSMTQREVNTQYGTKPVYDVVAADERKFGTFSGELASEIYALAFQNEQPTQTPIRVRYKQKPSKDPSKWPPTNSLESAQRAEGGAPAPAQAPSQPSPPAAFQPAPVVPAPQQTPPAPSIPQASGRSDETQDQINRSVAVKAAAYYIGAMGGSVVQGDTEVDFWGFCDQIVRYIETGRDPVPF